MKKWKCWVWDTSKYPLSHDVVGKDMTEAVEQIKLWYESQELDWNDIVKLEIAIME